MLLDLAKLILAKESRETFQSMIATMKANPEWKSDLHPMSAKFKHSEQSLADVFSQFSMQVLLEKGWPADRVAVVEFVAQELITNAFRYGFDSNLRGHIRLRCHLTSHWAEYTVIQPGRTIFDLRKILELQEENPRGLMFIRRAASNLDQPRPDTIVAKVERIGRTNEVSGDDRISSISIGGRLDEETIHECQERLEKIILPVNLILDFSNLTYISSVGLRMILLQRKRMQHPGNNLILVLPKMGMAAREIFMINRLDTLLTLAESVEEARLAIVPGD